MTKRKRAEMTEHTSNKQLLTVDGRSFFFRWKICRSAIGQASSRLVYLPLQKQKLTILHATSSQPTYLDLRFFFFLQTGNTWIYICKRRNLKVVSTNLTTTAVPLHYRRLSSFTMDSTEFWSNFLLLNQWPKSVTTTKPFLQAYFLSVDDVFSSFKRIANQADRARN